MNNLCNLCKHPLSPAAHGNKRYHNHCKALSDKGIGYATYEALRMVRDYPDIPLTNRMMAMLKNKRLVDGRGLTDLGATMISRYEQDNREQD